MTASKYEVGDLIVNPDDIAAIVTQIETTIFYKRKNRKTPPKPNVIYYSDQNGGQGSFYEGDKGIEACVRIVKKTDYLKVIK